MHHKQSPMLSVDDEHPTIYDIDDVRNQPCMVCLKPYERGLPITFVRLHDGDFLWWHRERRCLDPQFPDKVIMAEKFMRGYEKNTTMRPLKDTNDDKQQNQ